LLKLFLWKDKEEIVKEINNNPEYKNDIEDELADVLTYCI
jgi:NTP pyrophosphatase (non-canonical NTP hydrolase)